MGKRDGSSYVNKRYVPGTSSNKLHIKKKHFYYTEANEKKRSDYLKELAHVDPELIVYSDETGIDDNEVSSMGWSQRGTRCVAAKRSERKARYNIYAALHNGNIFAPFLFEGYSNAAVYKVYITQVLMPSLKPGMTLVIDNASFHKSKEIEDLLLSVGCRVIFLPPYSPDLNPIEHYWAAIKRAIRAKAQEVNEFLEACETVLRELCISY